MSIRTIDLLGKISFDLAKGCLLGAFVDKAGTFAGEQVTSDKERKVWTGFAGSVASQASLVYVLDNKRWSKNSFTTIAVKMYALCAAAFPAEKTRPAYMEQFHPIPAEKQPYADKFWQKFIALGTGAAAGFHATKRFGPVWGLVIGNIIAGTPVRV